MKGRVIGIEGAWLGVTPKKGTKYVRLLCDCGEEEYGKISHTLWLTEKTEENSIRSLIEYGFTGDLEEIWQAPDASHAANLFNLREGGVEVEIETEVYTEKATGLEKSINKISYIVGFKNTSPKMDKSELPKFKSANTVLRKFRAEANANDADIKSFDEE